MTEFTVQFTQPDLQFSFELGSEPIAHNLYQHSRTNEKLILDQQKNNAALLEKIVQFTSQNHQLLRRCEENIANLAIQYAETFLQTVFQDDADAIVEKIKSQLNAALSAIETNDQTIVWVNPENVQPISEYFAKQNEISIEVQADPLLAASDCRVEGTEGGWAAQLQHQFDLTRQKWFQQLNVGVG